MVSQIFLSPVLGADPSRVRRLCHILGIDSLEVGVGAGLLNTVVGARVALGVEAVDGGSPEVAGRHLLLEEDVELGVGAALGLGKAEEGPDEAEEAGAGVEETSLSAPVLGDVSHWSFMLWKRGELTQAPGFNMRGVRTLPTQEAKL